MAMTMMLTIKMTIKHNDDKVKDDDGYGNVNGNVDYDNNDGTEDDNTITS